VLRPETAAAMTRNAIGDLASAPGFGWGLGVQVLKDRTAAGSALSEGAWNWGGVYGTHFWVDPRERLSFVALTNTAVAGMVGAFPAALQRAVYGASDRLRPLAAGVGANRRYAAACPPAQARRSA
jgi:CubicO group peptidase (beta-lactamase class C family)